MLRHRVQGIVGLMVDGTQYPWLAVVTLGTGVHQLMLAVGSASSHL